MIVPVRKSHLAVGWARWRAGTLGCCPHTSVGDHSVIGTHAASPTHAGKGFGVGHALPSVAAEHVTDAVPVRRKPVLHEYDTANSVHSVLEWIVQVWSPVVP